MQLNIKRQGAEIVYGVGDHTYTRFTGWFRQVLLQKFPEVKQLEVNCYGTWYAEFHLFGKAYYANEDSVNELADWVMTFQTEPTAENAANAIDALKVFLGVMRKQIDGIIPDDFSLVVTID